MHHILKRVLIHANTTVGVGHVENIETSVAVEHFDFNAMEARYHVSVASGLLAQELTAVSLAGPASGGSITASSSKRRYVFSVTGLRVLLPANNS